MNRRFVLTVPMIALTPGCQPHQAAQQASSTQPLAAATTEFASPQHGVRLSYPATWSPVSHGEYVLSLVPKNANGGNPPKSPPVTMVSLDVPKLPPHIPGLIPLGSVVNGYTDDLKKQAPSVKIDPPAEMKVAGANAKRVRSVREANGQTLIEEAVLIVHGDRVYIFRANADSAGEAATREVLNAILGSVKWE